MGKYLRKISVKEFVKSHKKLSIAGLIIVVVCFNGCARSMSKGFNDGMNAAKTKNEQSTVAPVKTERKVGMTNAANLVREYTKEQFIVLSDYDETSNEYGETFVNSKIKTKSPIDGKNVTGDLEIKYHDDELVLLKVLGFEYVNKLSK